MIPRSQGEEILIGRRIPVRRTKRNLEEEITVDEKKRKGDTDQRWRRKYRSEVEEKIPIRGGGENTDQRFRKKY